jgi:hypothetical protein
VLLAEHQVRLVVLALLQAVDVGPRDLGRGSTLQS